jgi:hypothetical protein
MSNYNLAVNWSAKDASGTVISGDDFNTEFNAVKTAVNSKAELNGNSGETFAADTIDFGDWTITQSGTNLDFSYGGSVVFSITSAGLITAADDVVGFGTP